MSDVAVPGLLDRAIRRITTVWRDMAAGVEEESIAAQMSSCLAARGGEVSARNRAAKLAETYQEAGRGRTQGIPAHARRLRFRSGCGGGRLCGGAGGGRPGRTRHRQGGAAPRAGTAAAAAADPVHHHSRRPQVPGRSARLPAEGRSATTSCWRRWSPICAACSPPGSTSASWNCSASTGTVPAALLEKLVGYEAVHEIRSWRDLKNRLDSDRRCYAFFHPRMPGEPLIFVEVALVKGLAGSVQRLLDEKAPLLDPREADTAIFYSISNCQQGLAGISFGNFLIKRVVEELSAEFRNLKTFATLSPIPGFRAWLDEKLAADQPGLLSDEESASLGSAMPAPSGEQALAAIAGEARLVARGGAAQDRGAGAAAAVRALPAGGVRTAGSGRAIRWRISICRMARGWSGSTCWATPRRRAPRRARR